MRARVVRIGNSRGVRIPKPLIEQAGLRDEVEIAVEGSSLIIRAAARPRTGWAAAFRAMAERGDDRNRLSWGMSYPVNLGYDRRLCGRWEGEGDE